MKNTTNTTSKNRMIVLLVMMLLSGTGMFAQASQEAVNETINTELVTAAKNATAVEANPNLNMVSWLVGTKQTPKAKISNDGAAGKKQLINAGIAPNRLLIKAFLKKANDFQSTIA